MKKERSISKESNNYITNNILIHTSAFCLGDDLQQITDAHFRASSRNKLFKPSSRAYVSDFPSMIRANACGEVPLAAARCEVASDI